MRSTVLVVLGLVMAGCAGKETYSPAAGATGEDMFREACAECHEPKEHGGYFELDKEEATATAVAEKISKGGFMMPAFPNIGSAELKRLSDYVLGISEIE